MLIYVKYTKKQTSQNLRINYILPILFIKFILRINYIFFLILYHAFKKTIM